MKTLLTNEKGNMLVAMVFVIMGVMSGLTFTSLGMRDVVSFGFNYDDTQGLHFLRSEAKRCHSYLELTGFSGGDLPTPTKNIAVNGTHMRKTFQLRSRIMRGNIMTAQGGYNTSGYIARSMITSRGGMGSASIWQNQESIVRTYGEHILRKRSFAEFFYFTDNESSTNNTPVYFFGPDVIHGRVHSNTSIWIKQAGGGNNNNWPTFYGLVTTSGEIESFSGTPPWELVFRGGYVENYFEYEYPPEASNIRNNGVHIGAANDPSRIIMATISGGSAQLSQGIMTTPRREFADVYAQYPPPTGTPLYRNYFGISDTLWTPIGAVGANGTKYVLNKLWLSGDFQGVQTWGCADTIWLIGDITLQNTVPGQDPDGVPLNQQDIVGIVSEKSILIKYGHRQIEDSLRVHPNCGPTSDGIFIYAALCALGDGTSSYNDGVFSFEYQRPHGSTPSYRIGNTVYKRIDLHRRRYPQTPSAPWPGVLDFPWYNPLWPEQHPYLERGSIHLWGSVAQRRRGFVHRSPYDTEHPSNGTWNIPIDYTGASAMSVVVDNVLGIELAAQDYPGASGSGVGYAKNYHFDTRFLTRPPKDFPDVNLRGGSTPLQAENWLLKRPPRTF